jgi:hypothetical protein
MRRLLLLGVLAPLVLLGCGTDGDVGDEPAEEGGVHVEVTFDEPLRVGPVTWVVTVVNGGSDDLELRFPSGLRADVGLRRDGEEAYRWSRGQMFTQVLGTEEVPAGERRRFTLDEPGLDVDPGSYTLTATVKASNDLDLTVTRKVTVEAMRR